MPRQSRAGLALAFMALSACAGRGGPRPAPAPAFENPGGMWLPEQMPQFGETLSRLGLRLPPARLGNPLEAPLAAVVSLGGCSASFVSPDGLVITNHHCVTGALQYNSTPTRNLLEDGHLSRDRAEELWAGPTARVYVTRRQTDVSAEVLTGLEAITDPGTRHDERERRQKRLVAACEQGHPERHCEVAPFDEGARYLLIERLEIRDVRLVHAPASGIGNFGGEIDNWRWPRHTGDYAFLRAYVGPDGQPRDHAPDNVPFKPAHHLRVAEEPLRAGDFVMVAGYPGRTYRHRTALEVANFAAWYLPWSIGSVEAQRARLAEVVQGQPELAIKAAARLRGLDNALTNMKGTLEGLSRGGLAAETREEERRLTACIDADPGKRERFADVLPGMNAIQRRRMRDQVRDRALSELLRASSLLSTGLAIARLAEERRKPDAEREPGYQQRDEPRLQQMMQALGKVYDPRIDRALFELYITRALALPEADRPRQALAIILGEGGPAELSARLDRLYERARLDEEEFRLTLLRDASVERVAETQAPFVELARALLPLQRELDTRHERFEGEMAVLRPHYLAALKVCTPGALAPDANGTLRLTFGTVRGYRPTPMAPVYEPFTNVRELLEKHTGQPPFDAPEALRQAAQARRFGPYEDEPAGRMTVDFLADLDITGGNSGSPTLDRDGRLVGLVFDGNYESMASDWVFMPAITRSIHVDIRFVLWVMDVVYGADDLLVEMGIEPWAGPEQRLTPARGAAARAAPRPR